MAFEVLLKVPMIIITRFVENNMLGNIDIDICINFWRVGGGVYGC